MTPNTGEGKYIHQPVDQKTKRDHFCPKLRSGVFHYGGWLTRCSTRVLKEMAAQVEDSGRLSFDSRWLMRIHAAWSRSWQLLGSTLWSCWLVTELFSSSLQEAKVEQGERARSPSPHVRLRVADIYTSHRREPQVEVDMLSTFDGLPLQCRDQPLRQVSVCGCLA